MKEELEIRLSTTGLVLVAGLVVVDSIYKTLPVPQLVTKKLRTQLIVSLLGRLAQWENCPLWFEVQLRRPMEKPLWTWISHRLKTELAFT